MHLLTDCINTMSSTPEAVTNTIVADLAKKNHWKFFYIYLFSSEGK